MTRGAALYVGALIGPGLLLVPSLATQAAGPATIVAWVGLTGAFVNHDPLYLQSTGVVLDLDGRVVVSVYSDR